MTVAVLGFGPFLEVTDNPAARLARAVDGRESIVGKEMPVSYRRSVAMAAACGADLIVGVGVARGRDFAAVERTARRGWSEPDMDGDLGEIDGPEQRRSELAATFAAALDLPLSDDAGSYVCNGWLYRCLALELPVVFLHIPPEGFSGERLLRGIGSWRR